MSLLTEFIRPSSMQANELCAGKPQAEAWALPILLGCDSVEIVRETDGNMPDPAGESPQAREGTMGHKAAELLLGMIYPDSFVEAKAMPEAMEAGSAWLDALTPWTRACTVRYVTYIVGLVDHLRDERGYRIDAVMIEVGMSGRGLGMQRGGKADVVIRCWRPGKKLVVIVDLKLGFLEQPDADEHLQLGCYAVMAWDRWEPDGVHVHLAQARTKDFTAAAYDADSIEDVRSRVHGIIEANTADEAPRCACIHACRYCGALVLCDAALTRVLNAESTAIVLGVPDPVQAQESATIARRIAEEAKAVQATWTTDHGPSPDWRLRIIDAGTTGRRVHRNIKKALQELPQ